MLVQVTLDKGRVLSFSFEEALKRHEFKDALIAALHEQDTGLAHIDRVAVYDDDDEEWADVKWWWMLDPEGRDVRPPPHTTDIF